MDFTQILQFLVNHWVLVTVFLLLVVAYCVNEWWTQKTGPGRLSTQGLIEQMNHHQAVVIDLRVSHDFEQGHILHAMNIPQDQLANTMDGLKQYQDKPLVLVCGFGQKSLTAGSYLRKQGFLNIFYLVGGMSAWRSDNLPLEKM
jgi:rhodanese-related sulfurtransferase